MAIRFFTDKPAALLKEFDSRIAQKAKEGSITTWEKNAQGFYTHISDRWGRKAYLKARTDLADRLLFNVVPPKGQKVETEVYAYYHGHLIETFINHFSASFTVGAATAEPTKDDNLVSKTS